MLKKFASVRKILTLGLVLSIIFAAYSIYYKITYWGFSFWPKQTTKIWTIEAHVSFTPNGDPIKVSLASPYASDDFKILDEDIVAHRNLQDVDVPELVDVVRKGGINVESEEDIDAYLEDVFARIENENLRNWFKDLKQNS